jgi:hypothetical protein
MSTPEDLARWLEEGRELLRMLNELVEYLAQENERLRAELGRLVGTSILSRPSTGSPSRHWTAGFGAARPAARGSTRSPISSGEPVSRFRRSNGSGRPS